MRNNYLQVQASTTHTDGYIDTYKLGHYTDSNEDTFNPISVAINTECAPISDIPGKNMSNYNGLTSNSTHVRVHIVF
jgi:hypothetical protein